MGRAIFSPSVMASQRSIPTTFPEIEKVSQPSDIESNILIQKWGSKKKIKPIDNRTLIEKAKLWEKRAIAK